MKNEWVLIVEFIKSSVFSELNYVYFLILTMENVKYEANCEYLKIIDVRHGKFKEFSKLSYIGSELL